jgi:hypothetical protein
MRYDGKKKDVELIMLTFCPSCDLYVLPEHATHEDHVGTLVTTNSIVPYPPDKRAKDTKLPSGPILDKEDYVIGVAPGMLEDVRKMILHKPRRPTTQEIEKHLRSLFPDRPSPYKEDELDQARRALFASNGRKPTMTAIQKHAEHIFGPRRTFSLAEVEGARLSLITKYREEENVHRIAYDITQRRVYVLLHDIHYLGPPPVTGPWSQVPEIHRGSMFDLPNGMSFSDYEVYLRARCRAQNLQEFIDSCPDLPEPFRVYINKVTAHKRGHFRFSHLRVDSLGDDFHRELVRVCDQQIVGRGPRRNQPSRDDLVRVLLRVRDTCAHQAES